MDGEREAWERERRSLLHRRISELGLGIAGSPLEPLVRRLYDELDARGLVFHPPVYLSDEWGCPSGVPLIGVPFYLADPRLARLEEERSEHVEGESEALKYLRHEAGHVFNYAYRLYDRADWRGSVDWAGELQFPLIVKPPQEDASIGITTKSVVRDVRELLETMGAVNAQFQQPVLVEQFIPGREFYVGVLGNAQAESLPLIELDFSRFPAGVPHVASWQAKWEEGDAE